MTQVADLSPKHFRKQAATDAEVFWDLNIGETPPGALAARDSGLNLQSGKPIVRECMYGLFACFLVSYLGCDIGGAKELGVIYFPTNWELKSPRIFQITA